MKTQDKRKGFSQLILMIIMSVVAIALPVTTKLVQQSQENRGRAASSSENCTKCETAVCGGCSTTADGWRCQCTGLTQLYGVNVYSSCSGVADSSCKKGGTPGVQNIINGSCGSTKDTCSSGTFSDTADSDTQYKWNCNATNGGINASCTASKTSGSGISSDDCYTLGDDRDACGRNSNCIWNPSSGSCTGSCQNGKTKCFDKNTLNKCVNNMWGSTENCPTGCSNDKCNPLKGDGEECDNASQCASGRCNDFWTGDGQQILTHKCVGGSSSGGTNTCSGTCVTNASYCTSTLHGSVNVNTPCTGDRKVCCVGGGTTPQTYTCQTNDGSCLYGYSNCSSAGNYSAVNGGTCANYNGLPGICCKPNSTSGSVTTNTCSGTCVATESYCTSTLGGKVKDIKFVSCTDTASGRGVCCEDGTAPAPITYSCQDDGGSCLYGYSNCSSAGNYSAVNGGTCANYNGLPGICCKPNSTSGGGTGGETVDCNANPGASGCKCGNYNHNNKFCDVGVCKICSSGTVYGSSGCNCETIGSKCVPGSVSCSGSVLRICNSVGTDFSETPCDAGCSSDGKSCNTQSGTSKCNTDDQKCVGENKYVVCDDNGEWENTSKNCGSGEICTLNNVESDVCKTSGTGGGGTGGGGSTTIKCTSYTYSDWSSCTNGTKTRTITNATPSGCTDRSSAITNSNDCNECSNGTKECVSTSQARTCNNGSWVTTNCNSSQLCSGGSCVTKSSTSSTVEIKLAFAGVKKNNAQCATNWTTTMRMVDGTGASVLDNNLTGVPTQTTSVNSKNEVIYTMTATVTNVPTNGANGLAMFLTGPKHISIKYGKNGQSAWYSKLAGELTITGGTVNSYDFSGYAILAGDVTGDTTGVPDGKIDGRDWSYVKERVNSPTLIQGDPGTNVSGDIDGNCIVNTGDERLLNESLKEINGQTY